MVESNVSSLIPELARNFEQIEGAVNVRLDKIFWTEDRSVNMTFGREVDNNVDMVAGEHLPDSFVIANISALEEIRALAEFFIDICEIQEIPCIGQFVKIDQFTIEVSLLQYVSDEIRSYETGAAGHQDIRR